MRSKNRRQFIKSCCTAGAAAIAAHYTQLAPMSLLAQTASDYKALVCVFLFGGHDSNNLIVPIDSRYGAYAAMRGAVALPFHRADKKIPTVDASGNAVKPEKPNGVKFEMFVFDAVPSARNPIVIETLRQDDFSPVKNAEGLDSPKTSRDDQLRQFARWLKANGATIETDASGLPKAAIEAGLTTMVLPLPQIAARLAQLSHVEGSKGRT